ncbi:hypothetical protein CASFOL_033186 [Castilleja foliolosa]|uniref:Uncharacterized protein n=1 Tax=Castilleja foliolosa TaxID=1961234 RepID=A0ABD3C6C7_9LAMI
MAHPNQLDAIQQQLIQINNRLNGIDNRLDGIDNQVATINARAALGEARKINSQNMTVLLEAMRYYPERRTELSNAVDYKRIPKLIPGHPNVELPHIQNMNMQAAYEIGDLPPPNLLPRNDAAYTALKSTHQNLSILRTTVRSIQWFYHDPKLGPMLNENATRDDCCNFLYTLEEYIKL